MTKIQIKADQNPKIIIGTKVNLDQSNKCNARTVGKLVTLGGNAKVLRRNLIQSLKYVFSLAMVMRNLAIGFGMNKTGKSSEVEM